MPFTLFSDNWDKHLTKIQNTRRTFLIHPTSINHQFWSDAIQDAYHYMEKKITTKPPTSDADKNRMQCRLTYLSDEVIKCTQNPPSAISDFVEMLPNFMKN